MSYARRMRRAGNRAGAERQFTLAALLDSFYTFLGRDPQPSDEEVREAFMAADKKWQEYCRKNHMTSYHLFKLNVAEAWNRHKHPSDPEASSIR